MPRNMGNNVIGCPPRPAGAAVLAASLNLGMLRFLAHVWPPACRCAHSVAELPDELDALGPQCRTRWRTVKVPPAGPGANAYEERGFQ